MTAERVRGSLVSFGISLGAAALALGVSLAIIAASGNSAIDAMRTLWEGAFGSNAAIGGTFSKLIPLVLVALGWIVAFSARLINVGFEGQILIGGATATAVGLQLSGLPTFLHLPLAVLGGAVGGAAFAGIAAWLWARRGVNEVISTLILNFVAIQLVSWLVHGPLASGDYGITTNSVAESARWPILLAPTELSWDLALVPILVVAVAFMLKRTVFGFHLRLTGANPRAARHAGVDTVRLGVLALLLSGAFAGLAGSSLILASDTYSMGEGFSDNIGFEGIVVALLARNSPIGVIPAALLFAIFRQAGGLLEARYGIASELFLITEGLVVLLVAGAAFLVDRRRSVRVDADSSPGVDAGLTSDQALTSEQVQ